ncbi:flavodoxin family protein [Kribbella alba]|uniref:Flavodoxin family protein n=1 Tax=Kribbella alba TaxID=190197 RepID=A0ABN2FIN3_9ACTN
MSDPVRALVVYESLFGNTERIAGAICAGLRSSLQVELVRVDRAPVVLPAELELLVVGGPTHAFGMSRHAGRVLSASAQGPVVMPLHTGIRDWLDQLRHRQGLAATFDTRLAKSRWMPGSAAKSAARVLDRRGYKFLADPAGFLVEDALGPLVPGELIRAREWGEQLALSLHSQTRPNTADTSPGDTDHRHTA